MVIATVAGLVVFGREAIAKQLDAWQFLPRPEPLTEFYFTDHRQLPSTAWPGDHHEVGLTVHNLEHQHTDYHYTMQSIDDTGKTQTLSSGDCSAEHNDQCNITTAITVPFYSSPRLMIRAVLEYNTHAQSVHYWLDRPKGHKP